MHRFIGSEWGIMTNAAAVRSISIPRKLGRTTAIGDTQMRTLHMLDGSSREVSAFDVTQFLERVEYIIPVAAGSVLIYVGGLHEGYEVFLRRKTLIAFGLCADGLLRPITPSGVDDGGLGEPAVGWFVQSPGLPIEGMGDYGAFETEEELLDFAIRFKAGEYA